MLRLLLFLLTCCLNYGFLFLRVFTNMKKSFFSALLLLFCANIFAQTVAEKNLLLYEITRALGQDIGRKPDGIVSFVCDEKTLTWDNTGDNKKNYIKIKS